MRNLMIFCLSVTFCCGAQALDDVSKVEALKAYLLDEDYPEVFDSEKYRISIENVIFDDIDGNGDKELIVHFKPHFRQSPTIVIYKITDDLKVSRVMEGLAPGALVKLGDYYLDSHSVGKSGGHGVDFTVESENGEPLSKKIIETALKTSSFGNLVLYPSFIHADGRLFNESPTFIDLSYLNFVEPIKNCESFEFHDLLQIKIGFIDDVKYLSAWVGEEIYFYKISGITEKGFLVKDIWVIQTPDKFKHLSMSENLSYVSGNGKEVLFGRLPNKALQRTSR